MTGPGYDFELDPFQQRAVAALDAGRSVLVAAPTGAGKTVVAEHAVALALAGGEKAFYTTPLKALSNQKFGDLVRRHGAERVGLLTGDNAVNGDAPVVVMTTEVLRNMIYAGSPALAGLRFVVLDEVHYLQDPYRGSVWEEVIVHSAPDVRMVCLSATVSNAEEVAAWLTTVRGATEVVIEERRPVQLEHLYLVGDRSAEQLHLLPTLVDGSPNPQASRLDATAGATWRGRGRPSRRLYTPGRLEVVERLGDQDLLPAIVFIFSRRGCDEAVRQCYEAGLRLTTREERAAIRAVAEQRAGSLSEADLDVLGYDRWLAALDAGLAAHHAGMVPVFKEAVEALFAAGLVKVVFATETLSLGINMPARAVVIEKLSKFTGERHELLTPGEYTQLAGRAGRRGIDERGFSLVLWSPFVPFETVASLASTRTYELRSSFRPTYNMAANLVRRYAPDAAHHLLNLSFAQFQADRAVVRMEASLERVEHRLARARASRHCERGDVDGYLELRRRLQQARDRLPSPRRVVSDALARLRPGEVVHVPGGTSAGAAAVLSVSERRGGDVRVRALTPARRLLSLGPADFEEPPAVVGRVDLPRPYLPNHAGFQKQVAERVRRARLGRPRGRARGARPPEVADLEAALHAHPVAACPDLDQHLRAAEQVARLEREHRHFERRIRGRTESLARQFDKVLDVLRHWGYLGDWALTAAGERLARTYHETDLLVAEALDRGLLDGLDPPTMAALVSCFTYEARRAAPSPARLPGPVRHRWEELQALHARLAAEEEARGLPLTRPLDAGFAEAAALWAGGGDLDDVLADEELTPGDFVRNVKQLVDLLQQVAEVAPSVSTRDVAGRSAAALIRGVVAASFAVSVPA